MKASPSASSASQGSSHARAMVFGCSGWLNKAYWVTHSPHRGLQAVYIEAGLHLVGTFLTNMTILDSIFVHGLILPT